MGRRLVASIQHRSHAASPGDPPAPEGACSPDFDYALGLDSELGKGCFCCDGHDQCKVGDSRDRALELFPQKPEDQEWNDDCGTTLDWVDTSNPMGRGDVYIRLKKGKIFQIESSTTRFHTAEDITTFSDPDKIRSAYKEMKAYVLLTAPSPALGDRPLVFWIDKRKGIAFELAFDPSRHKRYVYKVIVFEPNKDFCPEQEKTTSPKWQSISPYALEPSRELSPEP